MRGRGVGGGAAKTFALTPRKDWASHGSDAFRYLAMGVRPATLAPRPRVSVPQVMYSFTTPARRLVGPGPGSDQL
jgi:hypothetical protein